MGVINSKNRKQLWGAPRDHKWDRLAVQALGRHDLVEKFDGEYKNAKKDDDKRVKMVTQAVVEEIKANKAAAAEVAHGAGGIGEHSLMSDDQLRSMLPFSNL